MWSNANRPRGCAASAVGPDRLRPRHDNGPGSDANPPRSRRSDARRRGRPAVRARRRRGDRVLRHRPRLPRRSPRHRRAVRAAGAVARQVGARRGARAAGPCGPGVGADRGAGPAHPAQAARRRGGGRRPVRRDHALDRLRAAPQRARQALRGHDGRPHDVRRHAAPRPPRSRAHRRAPARGGAVPALLRRDRQGRRHLPALRPLPRREAQALEEVLDHPRAAAPPAVVVDRGRDPAADGRREGPGPEADPHGFRRRPKPSAEPTADAFRRITGPGWEGRAPRSFKISGVDRQSGGQLLVRTLRGEDGPSSGSSTRRRRTRTRARSASATSSRWSPTRRSRTSRP